MPSQGPGSSARHIEAPSPALCCVTDPLCPSKPANSQAWQNSRLLDSCYQCPTFISNERIFLVALNSPAAGVCWCSLLLVLVLTAAFPQAEKTSLWVFLCCLRARLRRGPLNLCFHPKDSDLPRGRTEGCQAGHSSGELPPQ